MKPRDFLDDDTIERFRQYAQVVENVTPSIEELLQNGMPVQEHLNRAREHLQWIAKVRDLFQIMK